MIVAVSGNIGAGKTTLVKRLSQRLNYRAELEAVTDNPYLERFYQDMHRWSFPLQVYFLGHRFRQGLSLSQVENGVVLDRTIYEDAHVFARNLRESGYMNATDFGTYLHLYEDMVKMIRPPDLLIYLKGSPTKLAERIKGRGSSGERAYELDISLHYLMDLNRRYDQWSSQYCHSPLEIIDVDQTDLAREEAFEKLLETVEHYKDA